MRDEFTIRRLKDCLAAVDGLTADRVGKLYDKTIDFGAHPNVAALAVAFRADDNEQRRQFEVIYLTADARVIRTMKSVAQTGLASLLIFRNVFPERFDSAWTDRTAGPAPPGVVIRNVRAVAR